MVFDRITLSNEIRLPKIRWEQIAPNRRGASSAYANLGSLSVRKVDEPLGRFLIPISQLLSLVLAFTCFVLAAKAMIVRRQFRLPLLILAGVVLLMGGPRLHGIPLHPRFFLIGLRQRVYATMPLEQWRKLAITVESAAARTKYGTVFILGDELPRAQTTEDEPVIAELSAALKSFPLLPKLGAVIIGQPKSMDVFWGGGFGHWGFNIDFTTPAEFDTGRFLDWWASDPDVVFYMD